MSSLNYLGVRLKEFDLNTDLDAILLGFVLHGDKNKTLKQLYGLRLHHHSNPLMIQKIDKTIERFNKIKAYRFL